MPRVILSIHALFAILALAAADTKPTRRAVEAKNGLVATVCPLASQVGCDILKRGGNAVDAAIATAFALAITHPEAGNIGGGGFMLVHPAAGRGQPEVIDYRETAPAAATRDMFANGTNEFGHSIVGVPGTVRGLELAFERYASKKLAWKDLIEPAIRLAKDGFPLDDYLSKSLNKLLGDSPDFAELRRVYGKYNAREQWKSGDRLVLSDLAKSLALIAEYGSDAFYLGSIADQLVAEMKAGGGLITKSDLAGYRAKFRTPIHGTYRGFEVYAPPPPSSGGIALVQSLNILENFDLCSRDRFAPETLQLLAETMRRTFCDRARHLGDSDFVAIPDHLTSKQYAKSLAAGIDLRRATRSEDLAKDLSITESESDSTTHFSVIDKDGMAVANTYTLEHSYGSKIVVRGAGFLLNNEMMDFNHRPGVTSRKGDIGTPANDIAPGKRMLSSMTPTILAKDGKLRLVTGSPGGRTIINTVLCVVVNVVDYDMDVRAAVDAPRLHHQWLPDRISWECSPQLDAAESRIKALGHRIKHDKQGDAHSIAVDPKTGLYRGAADSRLRGSAIGY
jgi:gamma-glutamyltranspeptidase/glutathione hydrolase